MDGLQHKRVATEEARLKGDFITAIQLQLEICSRTNAYEDFKFALKLLILKNDYAGGIDLISLLQNLFPAQSDPELDELISICFIRCKKYVEALSYMERLLSKFPERANVHDGLSELYFHLGEDEKSKKHGALSLKIKAKENVSKIIKDLSEVKLPHFNPDHPKHNIISFSLFGTNRIYFDGAIANVIEAQKIYPGWTCRFYISTSVPKTVRDELDRLGAQMILVPHEGKKYSGLFWRFKVCSDPNVERYLIRDADSLLSTREAAAVHEWLASPYHFHAMRDFATHTELILAGLWGGVRGALPNLKASINEYLEAKNPSKFIDQIFLRQKVWTTFTSSCLIHDSRHKLENTKDFPKGSELPKGKYVGLRFDEFLKSL